MLTRSENVHASQNIGLSDRILRILVGAGMLGAGAFYSIQTGRVDPWEAALMAVSVYPLLTAIIGTDPFYSMFRVRSCNDGGRNQCGSFPYQVKAALGHAPMYCEADDDRSLETCHDDPAEHPHHAVWRVDSDPALYPDDKTMKEFGDHERKLKASHK